MIREAIIKLANKEDIGFEMAEAVMNEIMSGEASEVQKSAYLTALSMKGETIDEITASAKEMRRHWETVRIHLTFQRHLPSLLPRPEFPSQNTETVPRQADPELPTVLRHSA